MQPKIDRYRPEAEYFTEEKCFINEVSNTPDTPELSIARARVLPGVTTRWHRLIGTMERYIILEGTGRVQVGPLAPQTVGPGDVVVIPADCPQRITNVGPKDLIFMAVCIPRFLPESYEDLGDDQRAAEGRNF